MTKTQTPIKTTATFKSRSVAGVKKANPEVAKTATFEWEWARKVTFPTGRKGFTGILIVTAPGYQTRRMLASFCEGSDLVVK